MVHVVVTTVGEVYFNLVKNKVVYGSCSCFIDEKKIQQILNGESHQCSLENSDNEYDNECDDDAEV